MALASSPRQVSKADFTSPIGAPVFSRRFLIASTEIPIASGSRLGRRLWIRLLVRGVGCGGGQRRHHAGLVTGCLDAIRRVGGDEANGSDGVVVPWNGGADELRIGVGVANRHR